MTEQHTFVGSGPGFRCLAVVERLGVRERCGQMVDDSVHRLPPDITMVMQYPPAEVVVPVIPGSVMDAPAEDAVPAEEGVGSVASWSADEDTVRMLLDDGLVESAGVASETGGTRAAVELDFEGEIPPGPWPIRQMVLSSMGWLALTDLLGALWNAGIPFDTYVWWNGAGDARVVRVLWGEFLGLTAAQIQDRLTAWE